MLLERRASRAHVADERREVVCDEIVLREQFVDVALPPELQARICVGARVSEHHDEPDGRKSLLQPLEHEIGADLFDDAAPTDDRAIELVYPIVRDSPAED